MRHLEELPINHEEAYELAIINGESSNLARCYLALKADQRNDGWGSVEDRLPENNDPVAAQEFYRYKRYKPASEQFKRGVLARWQRYNGYGWDNAEPPTHWMPAIQPPEGED